MRTTRREADTDSEPVTGVEPATSSYKEALYQLSYTGELPGPGNGRQS